MLTEPDLRRRVGPILADGTPLRDLIDLDRREVALRVLRDPEIHRLELERIFARSWAGVAHVSEIPNAGDFVLRYIGEDPVIVARGADREVRVLLNVCAHRGMEVCWADEGTASQFKCPYHGWVFDTSGNLLGAPFEREMYGDDWDKSDLGLRRARVETRGGLVWATFGDLAPTLDDWLGEIGWYVDACDNDDLELLGPPMRILVHANWKAAFDQLVGDGYHAVSMHKSIFEIGFISADINNGRDAGIDIVHVSSELGHGVFCFNPLLQGMGGLGHDLDEENPYAWEGRPMQIAVFPQTSVGGRSRMMMQDGSELLTGSLITVTPRGPDAFEMTSMQLVGPGISDEVRATLRRMGTASTGIILADDAESWPSIQRAARGAMGQEQPMRYPALLGENRPAGWPGPGTVHAGFGKDDSQWKFWQRWFELLSDDER